MLPGPHRRDPPPRDRRRGALGGLSVIHQTLYFLAHSLTRSLMHLFTNSATMSHHCSSLLPEPPSPALSLKTAAPAAHCPLSQDPCSLSPLLFPLISLLPMSPVLSCLHTPAWEIPPSLPGSPNPKSKRPPADPMSPLGVQKWTPSHPAFLKPAPSSQWLRLTVWGPPPLTPLSLTPTAGPSGDPIVSVLKIQQQMAPSLPSRASPSPGRTHHSLALLPSPRRAFLLLSGPHTAAPTSRPPHRGLSSRVRSRHARRCLAMVRPLHLPITFEFGNKGWP